MKCADSSPLGSRAPRTQILTCPKLFGIPLQISHYNKATSRCGRHVRRHRGEDGNWVKTEWYAFRLRLSLSDGLHAFTGSFTPNHPPILATSLLCPNTKPSRPTSLPTSTNVPACTSKKRTPTDVLCGPLSRIDFVLSHPNGWEGKEQVKMRRAAVSAGFIDDTKRGHKRASLWMSCRRRNKQLQGRCQAIQANFRRDGCPPVYVPPSSTTNISPKAPVRLSLRQLACPTVSRMLDPSSVRSVQPLDN